MLHQATLDAFECFCNAASEHGFKPKIESGHRSFERQLLIWNEKVLGKRKILNENGHEINRESLSDLDCMKAILLWSALPGTSRHEWGTDIDVIDAAAVPEDYEAQLTVEESFGIFGAFHKWLDMRIETGNSFGFRRVFLPDIGRIQPEPWHLSYVPEASKAEQSFTARNLGERLSNSDILLLPQILDNLEWILEKHVFCYFLHSVNET
ncbi:MAG: M15 family metallopeptidase [Fibromonadaceae bacterium]|jgi:LAS superfamily LD-carboxypeptidase LdcB|nr:M15 family metallopeptidase [Fibromonadaceae bacterium]